MVFEQHKSNVIKCLEIIKRLLKSGTRSMRSRSEYVNCFNRLACLLTCSYTPLRGYIGNMGSQMYPEQRGVSQGNSFKRRVVR